MQTFTMRARLQALNRALISNHQRKWQNGLHSKLRKHLIRHLRVQGHRDREHPHDLRHKGEPRPAANAERIRGSLVLRSEGGAVAEAPARSCITRRIAAV